MIDPHNIPAVFTREYLEEFILFAICVPNKPAVMTAHKVDALLASVQVNCGAFAKIAYLDRIGLLDERLEEYKLGQYTRLRRTFRAVVRLNLDELSIQSLESIPGIGEKTARYIMLYYQPETACVPLDTHILRWLGQQGYTVPKATPTGRHYLRLEAAFVEEAAKRGVTVRDLDTQVWRENART